MTQLGLSFRDTPGNPRMALRRAQRVVRPFTRRRGHTGDADLPIQVWTSCHGKVCDLASAVVQDEEEIQRGELKCRDREEIDGPGYVHVTTQKRQPCRRSPTRFSRPVHVLAYGVRAGRVVPQKNEGVVDPLGAPEGILLAPLVDQALHLLGNWGPPTFLARLPSPEVLEGPGMPFLDGRRRHQMGEVLPPVQTFREDDPERPKAGSEPWPWAFLRRDFAFTGGELVLCGQESGGQNGLGAEDASQNDQGIADHFARPGQHATHVYQQASYGIDAGRIIESTACSKFT
jgi:hypothetical protein